MADFVVIGNQRRDSCVGVEHSYARFSDEERIHRSSVFQIYPELRLTFSRRSWLPGAMSFFGQRPLHRSTRSKPLPQQLLPQAPARVEQQEILIREVLHFGQRSCQCITQCERQRRTGCRR